MLPTLLLDLIGGESAYDGPQFGREEACFLEICTKLLMLCWSNARIRREVLLHERSPVVIEGSCVGTAKELSDWLFVDENEKPAGFLVAMHWAYDKLKQRQ